MIDALITWAVAAISAASLIGLGWVLKTLSINATPPDASDDPILPYGMGAGEGDKHPSWRRW